MPYGSILLTVTVIVSPTSNSFSTSTHGSGCTAFMESERCLLSLSYDIALTVTLSPSL